MANKGASASKTTGLQIGKSTLVVTTDGKKSRVRKDSGAKKQVKNGTWQVVKPRCWLVFQFFKLIIVVILALRCQQQMLELAQS